jgi:hypothetical protein
METYANYGGNSGVAAYEASRGSILVKFKDGSAYEYTNESAGAGNIETMIELAQSGQGLNTFISQHVRDLYARKVRMPR